MNNETFYHIKEALVTYTYANASQLSECPHTGDTRFKNIEPKYMLMNNFFRYKTSLSHATT